MKKSGSSIGQGQAEFTPVAIIAGILLAVIFGGANAYLGLRVGQTVSASIPAAVISMAVLRGLFKRNSILENNLVQTIGSAGEAIAAGAIFTIPAFFLWAKEGGTEPPSYLFITAITIAGGVLGVLFMIPLRRAIIARESDELVFPEGRACADVLRAGESGGAKAVKTFAGLGIGAAFKFLSDGLKLFTNEFNITIKKPVLTAFGFDASPALLGVGFVLGPKVAAYVFSGGVLSWYCIIPLLHFFGSAAGAETVIFPATAAIAEMSPGAVWSNYIRYIGAGAVAFGGIYSLLSSLPVIIKSFGESIKEIRDLGNGAEILPANKDLKFNTIIISVIIMLLFIIFFPGLPMGPLEAVLVLIFGFFFATVSARIVGIVGSSNSPVSGMTIATLLVTAIIFRASGKSGGPALQHVMSIAAVICIIASISGDTSQDLKTGHLLGATPRYQQIGEIIGVFATSLVIGGILVLLDKAWGFGTRELPAVQATLMKLISEGVMLGNLPWSLVFAGAAVGLALALLRQPVLPIAIGMYLPIYLTLPIFFGGIIRLLCEKTAEKRRSQAGSNDFIENGVLYSSGLIAGEGLLGILLAGLTVGGINLSLAGSGKDTILGQWACALFFVLLAVSILKFSAGKQKKPL
ncbi:MAG: oligopeptide transporter, OPT family [Termitinemataceae bacterium]|nr:MAG: oligopeptide transporter, OPT family [Termitinemataceae bacterium]